MITIMIMTMSRAPRPRSPNRNSPMTCPNHWMIAGRSRYIKRRKCTMHGRVCVHDVFSPIARPGLFVPGSSVRLVRQPVQKLDGG